MPISLRSEAFARGARMLRTALGPAIASYLEDPSIVEVMLNPDGRLCIDRLSRRPGDTGGGVTPADAGALEPARYDNQPVLTVRFSADQDLSSQYDLLERYFKKPIERIDGVARVELAGVEAREVRILVRPEEIDDLASMRLARDIVRKIEESLTYPGQIKVTVIRETRAVEYAK